MPGTQPPWIKPPAREKKLATKRAERAARKGRHWGEKIERATAEGPEAVAGVHFDRARAELGRLPERQRQAAFQALSDAIERVRQAHTE